MTNSVYHRWRSEWGFNFIEIILALVLFSISIPAIVQIFSVAFKQEAGSTMQSQALFLAHSLMEEISTKRFQESGAFPGNALEAGEGTGYDRRNYDDVDDYAVFEDSDPKWNPLSPPKDESGLNLNAYSGFQQEVTVTNVSNPTSGPTARADYVAQTAGTTNFKLVKVKISWDVGNQSVSLYKIFGKPS